MGLTRRGFMKGAAAGGAMFALPRLVRAQSAGSAYSVAVLGDTHFDQALQPEFVASYGDLTEDVSATDMARYTAQSTYHANWVENNQTHFKEFLRNGDMWRERCPSLVAASAALAASKPTRFLLQVGDLVQGDCNNAISSRWATSCRGTATTRTCMRRCSMTPSRPFAADFRRTFLS